MFILQVNWNTFDTLRYRHLDYRMCGIRIISYCFRGPLRSIVVDSSCSRKNLTPRIVVQNTADQAQDAIKNGAHEHWVISLFTSFRLELYRISPGSPWSVLLTTRNSFKLDRPRSCLLATVLFISQLPLFGATLHFCLRHVAKPDTSISRNFWSQFSSRLSRIFVLSTKVVWQKYLDMVLRCWSIIVSYSRFFCTRFALLHVAEVF